MRDSHSGSLLDLEEGSKRLANEYKYPHDYLGSVIDQQYMPDGLVGRRYYEPTENGLEAKAKARLEAIKRILDAQ